VKFRLLTFALYLSYSDSSWFKVEIWRNLLEMLQTFSLLFRLSVHWSRINFIIIRIHSWNFSHPCDCLSEIDAKFMNAPQLIFPKQKQCWTMVEFVTHLRGFSHEDKILFTFSLQFLKMSAKIWWKLLLTRMFYCKASNQQFQSFINLSGTTNDPHLFGRNSILHGSFRTKLVQKNQISFPSWTNISKELLGDGKNLG
jgi:hypothetical protein